MTSAIQHAHVPIYRVVRKGWPNPLDTTFSQRANADNRWNTPEFPALYCCCSEAVARAITVDRFRIAGVDLEDLQEDVRPQLVEIHWTGEAIDMFTESGIVSAGFPADYPAATERKETRRSAVQWHAMGADSVLCRSASVARLADARWGGLSGHPNPANGGHLKTGQRE
jgi:hypothetical protein